MNKPYEQKRTYNLIKLKDMEEEEFEVVGFSEGKGRDAGSVIWECITPDGDVFKVKPKGTREEKQDMFKNGKNYIGQYLTVIYQEMTKKNIPRFPIGKAFRKDY